MVAGDIGQVGIGGVASFADPEVGTGKAVSVSSLALSGTRAGNYLLSANTATALGDIFLPTKAPNASPLPSAPLTTVTQSVFQDGPRAQGTSTRLQTGTEQPFLPKLSLSGYSLAAAPASSNRHTPVAVHHSDFTLARAIEGANAFLAGLPTIAP